MQRISVQKLLEQLGTVPVFDARSPSEFESGHIPGAVSLPLFSDDERAEIGTIYKQESQQAAVLKGLEFVGPKMRELVESASELAPERKAILHCWRGGQRSGALAWLLDFAGFDIQVVEGGYKAYRNAVLSGLAERKHSFLVLGGQTGSGKTELLHSLRELGEQVIDLEGMANHKGSAFGWIGENPQPTSEQFANDLYEVLRSLDSERPVWIENESRGIGHVFMPDEFATRLRESTLVNVQVDLECRINRLVRMYVRNKVELKQSFEKIGRKLGGQHLNAAMEALERDDFHSATKIALVYYDKTYNYSLERANPERLIPVELGGIEGIPAAKLLIQVREQLATTTGANSPSSN